MTTIIGDAGDNVLVGGGAADTISGLAGADVLYGNAGDDSLDGGDGDDVLQPGTGNDAIAGGQGVDSYYAFSLTTPSGGAARVQIDLAAHLAWKYDAATSALLGVDTLTGIENAEGANLGDDLILGDAGANRLGGGGGDDVLRGGDGADVLAGDEVTYNPAAPASSIGNDQLYGEGGDDVLQASLGDDLLDGGSGMDSYYAFASGVRDTQAIRLVVDLAAGTADKFDAGGAVGRDTLVGIENVEGSDLGDDLIVGDGGVNHLSGAGGADVIRGGSGDDLLYGDEVTYNPAAPASSAGDDRLYGEAGNDFLQASYGTDYLDGGDGTDEFYAFVGGPRDTTAFRVVVNLGAGAASLIESGIVKGVTTLVSIENVTGSNLGADSITGDAGANLLVGAGGNDILDGAGGADQLYGGLGDDVFYVDDPGDVVVELAGQGQDIVHATVSWALSAEVERLVLDGAGTIDATGNGAANQLLGNAGANRLDGGAGDDVLKGFEGDDVLIGGTGQDTLVGGLGADTFRIAQASVYSSHVPAGRSIEVDTVNDLIAAQGDRLDLSTIDADAASGVDDAFHLAATFTGHAAEMVLTYDPAQGKTLLQLDSDGDGSADYRMWIVGNVTGDSGGWLL